MKMKNKVALALTLALGSIAAQAQDKGMDIAISMTPRAPAAPAAAPATSQPAAVKPTATPTTAAAGAANQQALSPVKPAPAVAFPAVAPVSKPAVANKVPARAETQKPVEPAQSPVQAPRATQATAMIAPVAQPAPAAPSAPVAQPPAVASASQVNGETNPFTGKDLQVEARQAQIESAKLDTELMIERLKQANLLADLTYLPLKKKAEVSTLPGITAAAATSAKPAATSDAEQPAAPRKAVKKKAKKAEPKPQPVQTATPEAKAPEVPMASLTGISINGDKASVILEAENGGILSANDGDMTPYGRLRVVNSKSVILGTRHLVIRDAMLSRLHVSDQAPVDDRIKNNTVITAPQATKPASANIPLPPLPPLPKAVVPRAPAPMPTR